MADPAAELLPPLENDPSRRFWYAVLNLFPFLFLPLVALLGILCSLIMPHATGVYHR